LIDELLVNGTMTPAQSHVQQTNNNNGMQQISMNGSVVSQKVGCFIVLSAMQYDLKES